MRCAKARSLFSSYLENELEMSNRMKFEEHLAGCSECKLAYDRFNAAVVTLAEIPEVDPPADFHERVMARVRQARNLAPVPVRWWQIDWQHVFTVRVPVRSAAVALAALLLFAVATRYTPFGTVVWSGVTSVVQRFTPVKTELPDTAPPIGSLAAYDDKSPGLRVGIEASAGAEGTSYDLLLKTDSSEPVQYSVVANGIDYRGVVTRKRETRVNVSTESAQDVQIAGLSWKYQGSKYVKQIFLPGRLDPDAHLKKHTVNLANQTVSGILGIVARSYGVVIIASGDLGRPVPSGGVVSGTPQEVLYNGVAESTAQMNVEPLGGASVPAYVVYRVD